MDYGAHISWWAEWEQADSSPNSGDRWTAQASIYVGNKSNLNPQSPVFNDRKLAPSLEPKERPEAPQPCQGRLSHTPASGKCLPGVTEHRKKEFPGQVIKFLELHLSGKFCFQESSAHPQPWLDKRLVMRGCGGEEEGHHGNRW